MKTNIQSLLIMLACFVSVHQVAAQGTAFTYQGRVQADGTNFTGTGLFKFALVTSTNISHTATAVAVMGGSSPHEFVNSYNVTYGGSGYASAPNVTISGGGGSGAVATASINGGGVVTGITVINPGSGYTGTPVVTVDAAPANISYTTYWSNDGTSSAGSEPAAAVGVGVSGGLFTVVLGDTTLPNMAAISASLFDQPNLQLRMWFDDGINGSVVLNPVQNLTPTPYAVEAVNANSASNLLGTLPASQLGGIIPAAHLPGSVVTNNAAGLTLAGTFTGNGAGLTGVSAAKLGGLTSASFWQTNGNAGANPTNGAFLGTTDNLPLEFRVKGQRALRIEYATNLSYGYSPNIIGGYPSNVVGNGVFGAVIGGGGYTIFPNVVGANFATVVGGAGNTASGFASTAMGYQNTASGNYSTAMGAVANAIHAQSFVWNDGLYGTFSSTAPYQFSVNASGGVVLAGEVQIGTGAGDYHYVGLGTGNSEGYIWGSYPYFNADWISMGDNFYADANGNGQVFNHGAGTSRISAGWSEIVLAVGDVNVGPSTVRVDATLSGVNVYGTFNNYSDRNAKQDFAPVSASQILEKVLQLPVSEWSYKEDAKTRHIGPVAQDFHSVFNIGTDEKHIAPIDEGGIAFAAIQGLNQKLEETRVENMMLKQQNDLLARRLNELDAMVKQLAAAK